jgi:tRNA modification GTPase
VTATLPESATLAAALTPPGVGAIASLAIQGPQAWTIVRDLFRPLVASVTWPPAHIDSGQVWVGRFRAEAGSSTSDDVVLAIKQTDPTPWIEVHCHGGVEVVRWILEALQTHGIQVCAWQELERRSIDDPLQIAATEALARASTARTAVIVLDQYHGAFSRALAVVVDALDGGDGSRATQLLQRLAAYAPLGRHLTDPWRVAVMGAPNVGKSSLVNALAGYERSIVAPTPGTTRDVVTTTIAIDGWPIELVDTAGLREASEALEGEGIDRARSAGQSSDLILWVLDAAASPVPPPPSLTYVLLVVNKIDLPTAWNLQDVAGAVHVSALKGEGVPQLCAQISHRLIPNPPPPGAAVPFAPTLSNHVEGAYRHCLAGHIEDARASLQAAGACGEGP